MEKKDSYDGFIDISRHVFTPVYPALARIILQETGVNSGVCLDMGAGPGGLGIALARETDMQVILLDLSLERLGAANEDITALGLGNRVRTLPGDVHSIPLPEGSVDLVVSRGSIFFWENVPGALAEAHRVLKPGGAAWIGGGFASREIREQVAERMRERDLEWQPRCRKMANDDTHERFSNLLMELNPWKWKVINDESGLWINFVRKGEVQSA